ncbi:MAG: hypothetical protein NT166_24080 [Candidatus Aminicenantes bacterium]|nr:hypothetical protein [Candidatus Aminicenantes bacterium]
MAKKRTWLLSIILFSLIFIVGSYFFFHIKPSYDLGSKLNEYGYIELRPPTKLVPPGTLVKVIKTDPMIVGIVCPQKSSLGEEVKNVILESDSNVSEVAKEITGKFNINFNYLKKMDSKNKYSGVKQIKINLSNVKILEIPDDAVFDNLRYRSNGCKTALVARKASNEKVTLIKSVIQADVNYIIEFSEKLNADAKMKITKGLAIELGADIETVTTNSAKGKNLYWGIRDDKFLAEVTLESLPPTGGSIRKRLLNSNVAMVVNDSGENAPL